MEIFIKKHFLLLLILFVIATRLPLVYSRTIPFMYDHGRDSIQVMEMIFEKSPRLIGPRASIPGLFFGPAWYYFVGSAFIFGGYSPLSPVYLMLLVAVIEIILLYRYFGKTAALIGATCISWLGMTISAWNPHLMPLVVLGIFIVMQRLDKKQHSFNWFILGSLISIAFHFSSAFAVTLLLSMPLIIGFHRWSINVRRIFALISGFVIPFIPQLIFEVRHQFLQTRSIISYFSEPNGEREINFFKPAYELILQWSRVIFPGIPIIPPALQIFASMAMLVFLIYLARNKINDWLRQRILRDSLTLILPAYLLFSFTHFSSWYWYGTLPIACIIAAKLICLLQPKIKNIVLILLLSAPLINLSHYFAVGKNSLDNHPGFLPAKERAIQWIYDNNDGKAFAVYHFLPDVYDYPYQYLWILRAIEGHELPVDFSYRPSETTYIPEKSLIIEKLNIKPSKEAPENIFYVVEEPLYSNFLESWWGEQKFSQITESTEIAPGLKVFKATP